MRKHGFTRVIAVAIAGATAVAGLHFPATAATPAQPGTVKPADKAPAQPGTTKSETQHKKKPEAKVAPVKAAPPAEKAPAEAPPKPAPKQEAKPAARQPAPAPAPAVDQSPPKNPSPARSAPAQPEPSYRQPTYSPPANPAPVQQAPVAVEKAQEEVKAPSQAELATETVGTTTIRESTSPTDTPEETKTSVRESATDSDDDIELVALVGDTDVRDERDTEDEIITRGDEDETDELGASDEDDDSTDDESDEDERNEADTPPVSDPVVEPEDAAPATSVAVPLEETVEEETTSELEQAVPAPESVQAGAAVATTSGAGAEAEINIVEDETTWEIAPADAPSLQGGVAAFEDQAVTVTVGEFSAEIDPPEIPEPINDLAVEATGVSVDEAISLGQATAQQVSSDALAAIPDTTEIQNSIGPVDLDAWINVSWSEGE